MNSEILIYKYRIYPSSKQQERLLKHFNICREIYNILLSENKKLFINKKFDFCLIIKDIKITSNYYLSVHSQVLQNVADRLHKSFNSFFRRLKEKNKKVGYPRFKNKINSITYPQSGFKLLKNKIRTSKIGQIPIVLHRKPKGTIKTLTLKLNNAGQWHAYFSCKVKYNSKKRCKKTIGIDMGLKNFVTISNGEVIENPKYLISSEKKLKRIQRKFSRKISKSKNKNKFKLTLTKQHIKIKNQRTDFLHKTSHNLTKKYSTIKVEDLNINSMLKNRRFAKHISDASWYSFIQMLSYKAVMSGGQIIKVDPRNTSKTCSVCGSIRDMPLHKKIFRCYLCGFTSNRDLNASINIKNDTVGQTEILTPVETNSSGSPSCELSEVLEAGTKLREIEAERSSL